MERRRERKRIGEGVDRVVYRKWRDGIGAFVSHRWVRMEIRGLWFCIEISDAICLRENFAHLIPTPPATNTTLLILHMTGLGGGHVKLPPTLILSVERKISSSGRHSQAAAGFPGDF